VQLVQRNRGNPIFDEGGGWHTACHTVT
jgi:hypothetical protein